MGIFLNHFCSNLLGSHLNCINMYNVLVPPRTCPHTYTIEHTVRHTRTYCMNIWVLCSVFCYFSCFSLSYLEFLIYLFAACFYCLYSLVAFGTADINFVVHFVLFLFVGGSDSCLKKKKFNKIKKRTKAEEDIVRRLLYLYLLDTHDTCRPSTFLAYLYLDACRAICTVEVCLDCGKTTSTTVCTVCTVCSDYGDAVQA